MFFYSMGLNDNTIIEWKVNLLLQAPEDFIKIENIKDEKNYISYMLLLELKFYHFL